MSDGRLVAAGLRTVANIAKPWDLSARELAVLLGVSRTTYYRLQRTARVERAAPPSEREAVRRQLARPALEERLSLLLGIYADLQRYFACSPESADTWVNRPNTSPVFGGRTAMELMLTGRVEALWTVRRFILAMGNW